jgi:hypothetical protein
MGRISSAGTEVSTVILSSEAIYPQEHISLLKGLCNLTPENPWANALDIKRDILADSGADLEPTHFVCPRFDGLLGHIYLANMNLSIIKVIANNETRSDWVHNPEQHADTITDHGPQIGIEVNGHHSLIGVLALGSDVEKLTNFAFAAITCNEMPGPNRM